MKHLLILLAIIFICYFVWQITSPKKRRKGLRLITRHAIRLGALIVVALVLFAIAYYAPSTSII
ncbi:hypothetical protein [Piscinibacter gummiphilus]|uniref:DUF2909 domain-containing protein n=1 Tax=Piscinibacter gummiphilus TaxID=946333 RepID=A0ABZ0CNH0_9BURK|nr:hypothetical protein [Piscinibacter gummiphilus]WOB06541.1 hypothetical protein RXV79_16600 [Piscinibacter gummiphilus]